TRTSPMPGHTLSLHGCGGRRPTVNEQAPRAKLTTALDPNDADGRATVADIPNSLGMPNEGLTEVQQAMALNPRYPPWYLTVMGMAYESGCIPMVWVGLELW